MGRVNYYSWCRCTDTSLTPLPSLACCFTFATAVAARGVWSSDDDADVDAGNGAFGGDDQGGDMLLRVYPGGDNTRWEGGDTRVTCQGWSCLPRIPRT